MTEINEKLPVFATIFWNYVCMCMWNCLKLLKALLHLKFCLRRIFRNVDVEQLRVYF